MKSTFLKAIKVVALTLTLTFATSGVIFANGAGAPATALNGAGNGAGGGTTWSKRKYNKKRVAKRAKRRSNRQTAKA